MLDAGKPSASSGNVAQLLDREHQAMQDAGAFMPEGMGATYPGGGLVGGGRAAELDGDPEPPIGAVDLEVDLVPRALAREDRAQPLGRTHGLSLDRDDDVAAQPPALAADDHRAGAGTKPRLVGG